MHRCSNQRTSHTEHVTENENGGVRHSSRLQERENQGARKKNYYGPRIYRGRKNYPQTENQETSFMHFSNNAWEQRCPPRFQPRDGQVNVAWQRAQNLRQNSYSECYVSDSLISDDVPKSSQKKRRNRRKKSQTFAAGRSTDSNTSQSAFNNEDKYRMEQTMQNLSKEKEKLLRENRQLQMMLNKKTGDLPHEEAGTFQNNGATEVQYKFGKLLESELSCTICTEFFVKATTLSCSHTFCFDCISVWRSKKNHCPICRTKINGLSTCMVIDNLIDKMVENLSGEAQDARKAVVAERSKSQENKKQEGRKRNSPVVNAPTMYYSFPFQHETLYEFLGGDFVGYDDLFIEDEFSLGETSGDDPAYEACYFCDMQGHLSHECPLYNFPL